MRRTPHGRRPCVGRIVCPRMERAARATVTCASTGRKRTTTPRPDSRPVDFPTEEEESVALSAARGGKGRGEMHAKRIARFATLVAVVALAAPALAQAGNEVTKWNEIAVSTVNAQPALISAPPAGAVYVAMVQGAVYGAVNAADRHGRPYLVNRSFPKASPDAAAATGAYKVLSALFP